MIRVRISFLLCFPVVAGAQAPPPIIDVHLHAQRATDQGPPPLAMCLPTVDFGSVTTGSGWMLAMLGGSKRPTCQDPIWSPRTNDSLFTRTLAILERRNIIGITSGARVAEWQAASDRIVPGLLFGAQPNLPPVDSLRAWFTSGRYKVMGEVTIQYRGMEPGDPAFEPYLALAEELDIPVGIHMGPGPPGAPYLGFRQYRARLHSPLLLEEVLVRHPRLRLYIMHAGWPMIDDLLALMWAHPQVHVGVGIISYALPLAEFHRYVQRIVEAGFGKRVMFGSDQMVWPEALEVAIRNVESMSFLTAAQKRDLFYENAARFFRFTDEDRARHHGRP